MDRNHFHIYQLSLVLAATIGWGQAGFHKAAIAEDEAAAKTNGAQQRLNIAMKTLGGMQFWGDVHFFHDWRIQRNVFTGHYRLLDGKDFRYASGTLKEMKGVLDQIRKETALPPMSGKAVILLHGMIRSSKSMNVMREPLERDGYRVFSFNYPSTRVKIQESAEYLHRAVESLEGIEEINFIVHSMGGLVVRAYLAEHHEKRIKRMVMMGVPNLGARMADRVKELSLYRAIFGPAGQQLGSEPGGLIAKLPTPGFEFAVIAGARGTETGYNPLIPGDDDGTVSVISTRLPGAADFMTIPVMHSFLMYHPTAVECSVRFINSGKLRKDGDPQPIPKASKPSDTKDTAKSNGDKGDSEE